MTIIWKLLTTMVVNFFPWFASRLVFGHPLLYQPYPRLPTVPLLKVVFPDSLQGSACQSLSGDIMPK